MRPTRTYRLAVALAAGVFGGMAAPAQLMQQQSPGLIQPQAPGLLQPKPQPQPLSCSYKALQFTFQTGGDDLRGGNDNLDIEIHYPDGSMQVASNVNKGASWNNNTTHSVDVVLKQTVDLHGIKSIRLIHGAQGSFNPRIGINAGGVPDPILGTAQGGIKTEDNWNMTSAEAVAVMPGGNTSIATAGPFRFTGSQPSLDMKVANYVTGGTGGCGVATAVKSLQFVFKTGDDDLRGGNDNLNISVKGQGFSQDQNNVNQSQNWGNNSTHSVTMLLNSTVTLPELQQIVLTTTFTGGTGGDNWNMQSVAITAILSNGTSQPVITQGFNRFTGANRFSDSPGNRLIIALH
jgi:hypothetical protein